MIIQSNIRRCNKAFGNVTEAGDHEPTYSKNKSVCTLEIRAKYTLNVISYGKVCQRCASWFKITSFLSPLLAWEYDDLVLVGDV